MKLNGDTVDSMGAAVGRLGVPLEAVKRAKREGCDALKGSRVDIEKLSKWLVARKEPGAVDVLLIMVRNSLDRH
jgi:hypothetical protein